MRRIPLVEYRTARVDLTPAEAGALRAYEPRVHIAPAFDGQGYDITATSWVGTIQLATAAVEIHPKLSVGQLMFLLAYTLDPKAWRDEAFSYETEASLLDAIVPGFITQVRRATAGGLLHGYRLMEDSLPMIRGRVRFDDQIRNRYGRFPPVEVRYDEFTDDIEENRLIRAAVDRLGRLRHRSAAARRALRSIASMLQNVTHMEYPIGQMPEITYTRLNRHYRPAVELARLILRSVTLRQEYGSMESSAFLVDMNRLFEEFVLVALREALATNATAFPRGAKGRPLWLDHARRIRLRPDLSWWHGPECVFVGDVKYKRLAEPGVTHPDIYQMLAYCSALDLHRGMLVYAASDVDPVVHRLVGSDTAIEVRTIDLSGTPDAVLAEVNLIVDRIRGMAASAGSSERNALPQVRA